MQLKNSLLLVSALSAGTTLAMPTLSHRHLHDAKRAVGDLVTAVIDGKVVHWDNTYDPSATTSDSASPAPAVSSAAATTSAAAVPSSAPSTDAITSSGTGATYDRIMYKGNTGGSTYGSNIHLIDESEKDSYQYAVRFIGQNTEDWTVGVWNKLGADDGLNGMFGEPCQKFTLAPGQVQWVGFDANSQGSWSAVKGDTFDRTKDGQVKNTWGEFDFGNESNGGWSGFDVSVITAQSDGDTSGATQPMSICLSDSSTCSTWFALASELNKLAYFWDNRAENGIGGNLPPGKIQLDTIIDWNGSN